MLYPSEVLVFTVILIVVSDGQDAWIQEGNEVHVQKTLQEKW